MFSKILFVFFLFSKCISGDSFQFHINDTFIVNSSKYVEILNNIIKGTEVSEDSGVLFESFYVETVNEIYFILFIYFSSLTPINHLMYYFWKQLTI